MCYKPVIKKILSLFCLQIKYIIAALKTSTFKMKVATLKPIATNMTWESLNSASSWLCWPAASAVEPCCLEPCNPLMLFYLVLNEAFDFQTQEASKDLTLCLLLFSLKETEILKGSLASVRVWNTTLNSLNMTFNSAVK